MSAGDWRIFPSPSVPCRNCGGGDRWCRHFAVTFMVLKANDRRTSSPLPWPRSDYVRQKPRSRTVTSDDSTKYGSVQKLKGTTLKKIISRRADSLSAMIH
ncbi:hypothetical protein TNCV_616161 [Trichonephila clavipes]|nr:hypothetical protein TNCV_616161 [Trichonephila clavipes]